MGRKRRTYRTWHNSVGKGFDIVATVLNSQTGYGRFLEMKYFIQVHYAAINKLDVNIATGVTPSKDGEKTFETSYCMDFSGITDRYF